MDVSLSNKDAKPDADKKHYEISGLKEWRL